MIKSAKAHSKQTDLRDCCSRIELVARNAHEALIMTAIYLTVTHGGKIEISPSTKAKKLSNSVKSKVTATFKGM